MMMKILEYGYKYIDDCLKETIKNIEKNTYFASFYFEITGRNIIKKEPIIKLIQDNTSIRIEIMVRILETGDSTVKRLVIKEINKCIKKIKEKYPISNIDFNGIPDGKLKLLDDYNLPYDIFEIYSVKIK